MSQPCHSGPFVAWLDGGMDPNVEEVQGQEAVFYKSDAQGSLQSFEPHI